MMADGRIREAAESLLSTVSNPHYRNLSYSTSLNLLPEELSAGHRPQGRMSAVRRFFCLLLTFDVLFTSLMWLICVMMKGDTFQQIVVNEIVHYNMKTSLFDLVMLATSRFIVLLMFYGLLHINNCSVVAISTAATCAFLIAKVFVFDWPNASEPVYQVLLVLVSFTLGWAEAWFLDFRVLPQETQTKMLLDAIVHHSTSERTPLLHPHQSQRHAPPSTHGESTVNWFSPVDTPEASPRPNRPREVILTQEQGGQLPSPAPTWVRPCFDMRPEARRVRLRPAHMPHFTSCTVSSLKLDVCFIISNHKISIVGKPKGRTWQPIYNRFF